MGVEPVIRISPWRNANPMAFQMGQTWGGQAESGSLNLEIEGAG